MNAAESSKKKGLQNRLAVWEFFRKNPCHTKGEAAEALGLTRTTVGGHCQAIRDGWRPEGHVDG